MKKKLLAFVLCLTLILSSITSTFAVSVSEVKPITIYLNSNLIDFEQAPVIENGHTLVPFRAILEEMGISVEWDNQTKTITCKKDDKTVSLTISSKEINVNGEKKSLDVPAKIINGQTFVPLRAISESFGAYVIWLEKTKTILITSSDFFTSSNINETTEDLIDTDILKLIVLTDTISNIKNFDDNAIEELKNLLINKVNATLKVVYMSDNIEIFLKEESPTDSVFKFIEDVNNSDLALAKFSVNNGVKFQSPTNFKTPTDVINNFLKNIDPVIDISYYDELEKLIKNIDFENFKDYEKFLTIIAETISNLIDIQKDSAEIKSNKNLENEYIEKINSNIKDLKSIIQINKQGE